MLEPFDIGMLVSARGRIGLELYRIIDIEGSLARLEPISPGTEERQAPVSDLRRYQIRSTDEAFHEGKRVTALRCLNPRHPGLYEYEVEDESGRVSSVREFYLIPREGAFAPDPVDQLTQFDAAPWNLVSARTALIEAYFEATARSLGISGYNGARMLPIPHQINAARYALLFGRVRFLLADEVGLGKTVEAGLILASLRKFFPEWRTAVFVPQSLTVQWAFEMYGKFGKAIFALDEEDYDEFSPGIILPHDTAPSFARRHQPQVLIVDEAHRALADPKVWRALEKMSERAHAVLLLTATPRSDDADNLCRLLRLCDPERFGHIRSDSEIQNLLRMQGEVEDIVQLLRSHEPDLPRIHRYWADLGIADGEVRELMDRRKDGAPDRHALSHAAALVVDRYYPGSRVLRYQRKFLAQDNAMAMRIVEPVAYRPSREEIDVLSHLEEWLGLVREQHLSDDPEHQAAAASLIQACFSSPLAVTDWIEARGDRLKPHEGVTADPIRLHRRRLSALPAMKGEKKLLERLALANRAWFGESRLDRAAALPLSQLPRYKALVEAIESQLQFDPEAQLLIFTSFESNVRPLYQLLRRDLAGRAEVFHIFAEQPWRGREKNAFEFQEVDGASVLISDELGGEGRNFQFANAILHFDLPLAPWLVEQRIGRCDRVGRDVELDVDSQVVMGAEQLDEAIFEFFAEGVNVFNESIAPIEGSMDRVTRRMLCACIEEGAAGVRGLIETTVDELEKARRQEEEELLARSRVGVSEAQAISSQLDDRAELARLQQVVTEYGELFDSQIDVTPRRIAITVGEYHSLRGEPGVLPEMLGHFDRREAVRHERLEFFSPGHPFVRSMVARSLQDSPDRTAFVVREGLDEPVIVFQFLMQLDPSFFRAIRELPVDLQPPLFVKSAQSFGTRLLRIATTLEGELIPPDSELGRMASTYAREEGDESHHEGSFVFDLVTEDWPSACMTAAEAAHDEAHRLAEERLLRNREGFEDLLCEVLTRIFPTQEWLESQVQHIMESLARLTVEIDSAIALLPPGDGER